MSYPNKAKGWRNITVDEQRFRWRFYAGIGAGLKLQGSASSSQQALITMPNWHAHYEYFGYGGDKLELNEPRLVTSKVVVQAIRFALAHGWHPEQAGQPLHLSYENETFEPTQPNAAT